MYSILKNAIKKIINRDLLIKVEPFLRGFFSFFYIGNAYKCNICLGKWRSWIKLKDQGLCPKCGSLSRTRRLYNLLEKQFLEEGVHILDFSPSRSIYRKLKNNNKIKYFSTDFSNEFLSDFNFNICNIDVKDAKFDVIICYHILEHIETDVIAMKELYRVLKPNSSLIIQTPYKEGTIFEDAKITNNKDRLKYFGQEDHVRIYSIEGLKNRLELVGFCVEVNFFEEKKNNYFGFSEKEAVLICEKK